MRFMAFPRQFNKQVWYLQIPSGEIEIATSEALKGAYKCGLVDLRTPVRAFGAHTWQTMQEAAEIQLPGAPSIVSFAPVALSAPPPELEEAMTRQSRVDVDPRTFKPSRRPAIFIAVGIAACLLALGLGKGNPMKNAHAAAVTSLETSDEQESVKPMTALAPKPAAKPIREQLHASERYDGSRFSKDQKWKLLELDYITRTQRPKSATFKLMIQKPLPGANAPVKHEDPFSHGGAKGDPLDGTL